VCIAYTEQFVYQDSDWIRSQIIVTMITVFGHWIGFVYQDLIRGLDSFCRGFFMTSSDKIGCQKTIINFTPKHNKQSNILYVDFVPTVFLLVRRFAPVFLTWEKRLGGPF
jgi:hypothetical protein